jgi:hypothetical protein
VSAVMETLRGPLLAQPGRLETPGTVKRRLLVVAAIMALAFGGAYAAFGPGDGPWSPAELRDMAGLPRPPVPFAPTRDGDIRALSPHEHQQLEEIRGLIERFPVPDQFVNVRPPTEESAR